MMKKKLAVVAGAVSFVYLFVPDPSDVIPVLGWLDEGMAAGLLFWSLRTLGVGPSQLFARVADVQQASGRVPAADTSDRALR
jgi:hypothetical protein